MVINHYNRVHSSKQTARRAKENEMNKISKLTEIKNSLYDLASMKWADGDTEGQKAAYAEIDAIDAKINAVMKADEEPAATSEELTLKFDN